MKKWLIFLMAVGVVGSLCLNTYAVTELTRDDLQNIRVKMDVLPQYPSINDKIYIQGNIYFLKDNFTLETTQLTYENEMIFLDITVSRGDFVAGNDTFIDNPFVLNVEPLPVGTYILTTRLNNTVLFDRKISISLQSQPTPMPPIEPTSIPFYKPTIELKDKPVTEDTDVNLIVNGYLPDTAHFIADANAELVGQEIHLNMKIDSTGIGAEVLTPAEQVFSIGKLPVGEYYVLLIINGQPAGKTFFMVSSLDSVPVESAPNEVPFFKPYIELKDSPVTIDSDVTLLVRGYLPDTAHSITNAKATVQGQEIRLSMNVESSGIGADVLVMTEQEFTVGKLPVGDYYVLLMINDNAVAKYRFFVSSPDQPGPDPMPNNNPYQAEVIIDPANPAVNEEFMIVMKGMWPMDGYAIDSKDVEIVDHDIYIKLTVFEPNIQTFAPTEPVPFKELLTTLQLEYGVYTVHTSFYDQKVEPVRFWVGQPLRYMEDESNIISFRKDLAGETGTTLMNVDDQKTVSGINSNFSNNDVLNFTVDPDRMNQLIAALDAADFANLPTEFSNSLPPEESNSYVITYKGKMVRIYEGAPIPAALNDALIMLNQMAEDLYAEGPSSVKGWQAY